MADRFSAVTSGRVPSAKPDPTKPPPASQPAGDGDVSVPHPDYADRAMEWAEMRDTLRGTKAVREVGDRYLPMPSGFAEMDDNGLGMYTAYALRAQFPEIVSPTLQGMVGVIHRLDAVVEGLPDDMEYLLEDADGAGTSLPALHRKVTEELLATGRYALLADAPETGGNPVLKGYSAETLINWSEDRTLFVLDECHLVRRGFRWVDSEQHRVLELVGGRYQVTVYVNKVAGEPVQVTARGGAGGLDVIPLVVIGPRNLDVTPDNPPLIGVARAALAAYRLDADYRHQLFNSGQETLVFSGLRPDNAPKVVGAAVIVCMEDPQAKAQYVGPSGEGIGAHRQAILDEMERAAALGARVFDTSAKGSQAGGVESGEALRLRAAANTATLLSIALNSAAGLERALRNVARLGGKSAEEAAQIVVRPNLDFLDTVLGADEALNLVKVWQSGAISYATLYDNLQRGEIASMERDADEERDLIEQEGPPPGGGQPGGMGGDIGASPGPTSPDGGGSAADTGDLAAIFHPSVLEAAGLGQGSQAGG